MKRILWAAALASAVWVLPRLSHPAVDVGKLEPVETVLLRIGENEIVVYTDTGAAGNGRTLKEAWEELRSTAGAEVFPDTASKLLIWGDPAVCRKEILEMFRPSCLVCRAEGWIDPESATRYLSVHKPRLNLNRLRAGEEDWQTLKMEEGRGWLEPE